MTTMIEPSVPVLETPQLVLDLRRCAERPISDVSDFLGVPPLTLELLDLCPFVHGHLEREPALRSERAQRQLALGDVAHQAIGATHLIDLASRVLGSAPPAAGHVQVREALTQHLKGVAACELRPFLLALWAAQ